MNSFDQIFRDFDTRIEKGSPLAQSYIDEDSVREGELQRSLQFGRFVAYCNIMLVAPWSANFIFQGQWLNLYYTFIAILPTLFMLGALFTRYHYWGRLIWLSFLTFNMVRRSYFSGPESDAELTGLWLLAMPFLLFASMTEKRTQMVMICICSSAVVAALSFDLFGVNADLVLPDNATPMRNNFGVRMTVIAMLLAQMFYFVYLNRRLTDGLLDALRGARQAAQAKGEFLANMSHEIRTPMNGMVGMLEVLEAEGLKQTQRPLVGTIRNSALSLLRIIDDILDASKIEAGKMDVSYSKMELYPVIEGAAQTLRVMADENDVRIRHYLDPDLPHWIVGDSGRLRQILLNLLSNSVKYSSSKLTGRRGQIWYLVTRNDAGDLQFVIRDNGIGMTKDLQDALFAPFVQAEGPAKRKVGGTGLGLVISRNLVELMGGKITVTSTEGAGSEFTVTLPLKEADGPATLPDISGRQVICISDANSKADAYLQEFFDKMKVDLVLARSVEEAIEAKHRLKEAIFILVNINPDVNTDHRVTLLKSFPDAGFLVFSPLRSERFGMVSSRLFRVQARPILISEITRGIDALTRPIAEPAPQEEIKEIRNDQVQPIDLQGKILAVEDNVINRDVLAKQLEILGVPFDMAEDGQQGLEMWRKGQYELILTDCYMPVMDGFEMTAAIRTDETQTQSARIPILAITADAMQGKAEECRAAGMDDTLTKPIEMKELRRKMLRALHREDEEAQTSFINRNAS